MNLYVTDNRFKELTNNLVSIEEDTKATSILALARVIANRLTLDSSSAYTKDHAVKVVRKLYEINDHIIIPINDVADLVKRFYELRKYIAFPPPYTLDNGNRGKLRDVFGISSFLTGDQCDLMESNYNLYMRVIFLSTDFLDSCNNELVEAPVTASM